MSARNYSEFQNKDLRKTGIGIIGNVPWGTHFCQFYKTKEDLLDVLVPYFKKGLEEKEFCIWITAKPLSVKEAIKAMKKAMPDFERYFKKGQIEIFPYSKWYIKSGKFEEDRVLKGWIRKLNMALRKGFAGLRLTGNTFWIEKKDWGAFSDYEKAINEVIGNYKMLAMCTYSLDKCGVNEILDVANTHQFTIIKSKAAWRVIESPEFKESRQVLRAEIADRMRAEKELKIINRKINNIFERISDAFFSLDKEWRFTYINKASEKIFGKSSKDLLGQSIWKIFPEAVGTSFRREYYRAMHEQVPVSFEEYYIPFDKWYAIRAYPSRNGLSVYFEDITERKNAENALRASEDKYKLLVENLPQKIFYKDKSSVYISCNDNYAADLKIRPDEIRGKSDYDFYPKKLAEKYRDDDKRVIESGRSEDIEERYISNGQQVFVQTVKTPVRDGKGKIIGLLGIFWDITQRKIIEEKLRRSEEKYRNIVETANEGIWIVNADRITTYVNNKMAKMLGYNVEEMIGKSGLEFLDEEGKAISNSNLEKRRFGVQDSYEFKLLRKDGSSLWTIVNSRPLFDKDGNYTGSMSMLTDITNRKRMEEELRESEQRYATTLDSIGDAVIATDVKGRITFMNTVAERLTGWSLDTALQKPLTEVFHVINEYNRREVVNPVILALKKKDIVILASHSILIRKDKIEVPIEDSAAPIRDQNNNIFGVVLVFRDITIRRRTEEKMLHLATFPDMTPNPVIEFTAKGEVIYSNPAARHLFPDLKKLGIKHPYLEGWESIFLQLKKNPGDVKREIYAEGRVYLQTIQYVSSQGVYRIYGSDISIRKRMEEVLRKSEAKFKALYDANIIGVVIGDLENNIYDANDAFLNIIGYTREDLQKNKLNCNKLTIKKYKERDKKAEEELITHGVTTPWEKEYIRKDGSQVPVIIGKVLINKDTAETIAFVLDITERKKLDRRKDEFIGTASHELKTPITIIKAFTQILQRRFEKSRDTQNEYFVKNIDDQINRLTDLVNDLLDMSKIQAGKLKFNYKTFDIDSLIRKTIVDFQYITRTHQIERYGEVEMKIYGDEERIHQLLVNLLSNAVKYSPNSNRIIVRIAKEVNRVLVSVQDFGLGISESNREKIFERFYTGAEKEKRNIPGFGMGLYICKEIIKGHSGELWVESKRGEVSIFYFTIPVQLKVKN